MAAPNVHSLRKLQADLNAAIDSYVACIEAQPTLSSSRKAAAERVITDSANAITDAFRNPFVKVREIGLQVSPTHWGYHQKTKIMILQPTQNVVIRIALDLDLFNRIDGQVTLDELVAKTGAEAVLLRKAIGLSDQGNFD